MSTLRFNDGVTINTDGEYRITRKRDGLYVVGHGFMCAVNSYEEGREMIAALTPKDDDKDKDD